LEASLNTIHSGYVYHCYDSDIIETDLNEGNSSFEIKLALNVSRNLSSTRFKSCCRPLLVFNVEFNVKKQDRKVNGVQDKASVAEALAFNPGVLPMYAYCLCMVGIGSTSFQLVSLRPIRFHLLV
jgi:hypothetical protein